MPLRDVVIENVTVSADGNCVGRFNEIALDHNCTEDKALCPKWTTSGAIGGFITLEEADTVLIRDLGNKSLCSFLATETATQCPRDAAGKVAFAGDYCSKDKQPGSCADSVWMAATFAASAAKIFDGAGTIEACSGVARADDAGTDAATGSDAAHD